MAVTEEESPSSSSLSCDTKSRLDSSSSKHSYYLAKTVLRSSVVLQVVRGHIRSPSSYDVVFGKETSIELVNIDEDGVAQSICEQSVFGTIKDLTVLPWNERFAWNPQISGKDILVIISDSGKLSFLTFSNEMHRFLSLSQIRLSSPGNLREQVGRMLAVDSNGYYIAASAYLDKIALLSVSTNPGKDIVDEEIFWPLQSSRDGRDDTSTWGTIWSMCFISEDLRRRSKEHNPLLAIVLNRPRSFRNELLLVEWNTQERAAHIIFRFAEAGPLLHHIVEVPNSYGFTVLFRAGDALLMDFRDAHSPCFVYRTSLDFTPTAVEEQSFAAKIPDIIVEEAAACALLELSDMHKSDSMDIDIDTSVKPGLNYVCSWSWEPGNLNNPRMIFSADSGDLFLMEIVYNSDGVKVNLSDSLYKGLPSKELLWVEGGYLAAIIEMGDGMVLKLEEGGLYYRSPIQNIAPILDMAVVDYHDEKHDQMFACCGMAPEGSLRIIRSGISTDKLLKTAPVYHGITGTWAVKKKIADAYHSFLVLSFVEETRVLSVGVNFSDVTDLVGFQPDVCTLACGLVADNLLAQIHQNAVRLCMPIEATQLEAIPSSHPFHVSWSPDNISISLGAVGQNVIVVESSNPCFLYILGVRSLSAYRYEIFQMQQIRLQHELSCISIAKTSDENKPLTSMDDSTNFTPTEVDIKSTIIIGTHKPSVEVLSFAPDGGLQILAIGNISLTNTAGAIISGCVPEDVRLVLVDQPYILSGLRNGMLLRFEWPPTPSASVSPGMSCCLINSSEKMKDCSPVYLRLVAVRRIGITPAFLVPLSDSLDADFIALSDRPWLLHTARRSLSYTSISFQPSTHVTPVCSIECPNGILFVAESSLHLVEMVPSKRLNVQKFHLGGTPRKVLYHSESKLLLVLRTELHNDSHSSDVCCVDPLSGSLLSSFKFEPGETGKCMELVKVGHEHVLVVGTSLSAGPAIMPSGEAESTRGRLIVLCIEQLKNSDAASVTFSSRAGSYSQRSSPFREVGCSLADQPSSGSLSSSSDDNSCEGVKLEESETWHLRLAYSTSWPGMVLAVCPYLEHYFLASYGNSFFVCSFPYDNPQRVRRSAMGKTRFMIMTLTAHFTTIAVGDCRDGILFYTYHEDSKKLEQLYCDPVQRLVADCILMDVDTAVVSDRKGSIAVLSCSNRLEDNANPECNLTLNCSYFMGEVAMSIRKGSFSYQLPADEALRGCTVANSISDLSQNSIMASTLLGSVITFIPISREEYELLEIVQTRLLAYSFTAPILGNDHTEFRSRESLTGVRKMLDGDMLAQFLDLTSIQQEAVLGLPMPSKIPTANQAVRLLERVHYALH